MERQEILKGKVAFITGASRGIGAGIARALAESGAKLVLTYAENDALAEALRVDLCARGAEVICVSMQSADRDSIRLAVAKAYDELGEIDILVNNAAIAQEKPFDSITDDDWDYMFAVNLRGPFALTQEVLPAMIRNKWGRIVNISSIGGQLGGINQVHYASTKAGLIGLTRSISRIYSPYGITCNAIAPGLIETDMTRKELATEAGQKKLSSVPVGRIGKTEDIGAAVQYLCGPGSSYITGQTLNINGGSYFG